MSERSEFEAVVDELLGGTEEVRDHSPEAVGKAEKTPDQQEQMIAPEGDFMPYSGDEYGFFSDSAENESKEEKADGDGKDESVPEKTDSTQEEPEPEKDQNAELTALQEEIANYKKRLHDTQKAMHEANTAKAELQKELDSLKQKSEEDDDDDWFADSDEKDTAVAKIEKELAEVKQQSENLKNQQEEYQQELRRQKWFKEAEELSAKHSDFEELVYKRLEPLLNEETGDPMLRALYLEQEDRTPAGAYEFAKKLFGYKDKLDGKTDIPEEKQEIAEKTPPEELRGQDGLDRVNSADFKEDRKRNRNVIEEIFG